VVKGVVEREEGVVTFLYGVLGAGEEPSESIPPRV